MKELEELSLSGKLTLEDFVKYNQYHTNKVLKVYFVICFIVLFFVFQIPMSGDWLPIALFAGLPSLLLSGLIYLYTSKVKKYQAIKEYKSDQLIKRDITYTFSSEGVIQITRKSNNRFDWIDFLKAQEYEELFLMYLSRNKAIVLPKRFFRSKTQMENFKHLVSDHINETELYASEDYWHT